MSAYAPFLPFTDTTKIDVKGHKRTSGCGTKIKIYEPEPRREQLGSDPLEGRTNEAFSEGCTSSTR